jgi:hypothetical protein
MRLTIRPTLAAVVACTAVNCTSSPASPGAVPIPAGIHRSAIASVTGPGSGGVSVSPKSIPEGTFAADISLLIADARPSATYVIQRAPEIGRALAADGVCQRALGLAPWSAADPPAPAFVTFALATGPATLTTAANGTGVANFEFRAPTIPAGTVFDVMFRLVDSEVAATTELRSGCFTVTAK